ncbi:MAG TPA: M3 family metallopeptidase [Candidatus Bathyarchaeia archaeon]|nr:M3 family metallopeptidase [Candidatus Bathyarchaeia archaeon]
MPDEIPFDLSDVYSGLDDPAINKTINQLNSMVDTFIKKHQGKIKNYDADSVLDLLIEYEKYLEVVSNLRIFAGFSFYGDMTKKESQTLYNQFKEINAINAKKLSFYNLELGTLLLEKPDLLNNKILHNYYHYLEQIQELTIHRLTPAEEQLVIEKDLYGVNAWSDLQSKWSSTREFEIEVEGKKEIFHMGERNKYAINENREVRKQASYAVSKDVVKDGEIYSYALRNIFSDWVAISKRRKYSKPIDASLLYNEIDQTILDNMFSVIEKNVQMYKRVLKIRAKLLGLPKLAPYDTIAPIPGMKDKKYSWQEAQELILSAFSNFDQEFVSIAKDMFERKHIDATPRKGKTAGAFCSAWYAGKSSFILQSFNENLESITTLAHELGHAIHGYLMYDKQTLINCGYPSTAAETASFFGELLLIDLLLNKVETKEEKIDILLRLVSRIGHVIFGLTPMYWFESDIYGAIERGEYLDYSAITKYWVSARDKIYGEEIEWYEESNSSWCLVPHYFLANNRFYNYPYIFAQLFVYALYQQYLKEKETFLPKFKQILSAGGSIPLNQLGEIMGLDITKPEFWELGIKQFEYFLNELEKLI